MKLKRILIICFGLTIILTSCGQQQTETSEQEVSETTETEKYVDDKEQNDLSELEKQIKEFEEGTSDEITITQDILRGEWRMTNKDDLVKGGFTPETVKLGNLEVDYDTSSKDSKIIFTDDEFMISYDEPEVKYGEGEGRYSKIVNDITVSGLYRVISQDDFEQEKDEYKSEIELLITNVSPRYGIMDEEIYNELNSLVGKTMNKKINLRTFYEDWSNVTEEQLDEFGLEVHEQVTIGLDGTFGFREDGTYGFSLYDTPISTQTNPMTWAGFSEKNDNQLFTQYTRTKVKNSVSVNNREVEPGVWLYDVVPHEAVETIE